MKYDHPTLLIVDDDENDRLFMAAAFARTGINVTIRLATGVEEAIAYLMGTGRYSDRIVFPSPDYVITDLKMPGTDGFQVLQHIRHCPKSSTLPVVILSGSQDNDDIDKALSLGANSYHLKPSSPYDLRDLLKALCSYWALCEFPVRAGSEKLIETEGRHKLGAQSLQNALLQFHSTPSEFSHP